MAKDKPDKKKKVCPICGEEHDRDELCPEWNPHKIRYKAKEEETW